MSQKSTRTDRYVKSNEIVTRQKEREELTSQKYQGKRDDSFKTIIQKIIVLAKIPKIQHQIFLSEKSMKLFSTAFTHSSFDEKDNYEYFEIIGDQIVNTSVVKYIINRFSHLQQSPENVKVIARLRINLISTKVLSDLALKLGFWDFISSDLFNRKIKKKKLLEDCFEAFIGTLWTIFETEVDCDTGYRYCYNIIETLLNTTEISLDHDQLYDAKSRLKEYFDTLENKSLVYRTIKRPPDFTYFEVIVEASIPVYTFKCTECKKIFTSTKKAAVICPNNSNHKIDDDIRVKCENRIWGTGTGSLLKNANQSASEDALNKLKAQ